MKGKYHVILKAKSGWFDLDIKGLWRYRDLVFLFVRRNFVLQFKQTILGPLWLIAGPIISSVVFTVVFGQFAGLSSDGLPYILFYFSGNILWNLFSGCVLNTANTFITNGQIMGKVYFPRLAVPLSQAITLLCSFGLQFILLCAIQTVYLLQGKVFFGIHILWVPLLLLHTLLLGLGIGLVITSLTTKYRDLVIATGFGLQLWMYASPVVYPMSSAGGMMRTLLLLNPVTSLIENFRYAMFGSGILLILPWMVSFGLTVGLLVLGLVLFSRSEKTFLDTV